MSIVVLRTDLFPDARTLEAAVQAACDGTPTTFDLTRPDMEEADWERIVDALLSAERIITL